MFSQCVIHWDERSLIPPNVISQTLNDQAICEDSTHDRESWTSGGYEKSGAVGDFWKLVELRN